MKPGTLLREPWPRVIGIPVLGFLLTFVFTRVFQRIEHRANRYLTAAR